LRGSLEHYAAEFERRFAIKVDLAFSGSPSELTADSAVALFRIVQESLTNVARHAQAHHVSIVLSVNGDDQDHLGEQTLVIEDDGLGFDVKETLSRRAEKGNLGIFGIEERIRLLGGSCQIESTPGQGTALYVRIPREARSNG
jgi:signal transduction histidine kinase